MSRAQAYDVKNNHEANFAMTQFTVREFNAFWPKLEAMLDAIPHTWRHWTKQHILDSVRGNSVQVWGVGPPPNAVLIMFTTVTSYPAMKVMNVVWSAGTFDPGMSNLIFAAFVNYAQINECQEIEVRGRPGWNPFLKAVGFKKENEVWSYKIPDARMH